MGQRVKDGLHCAAATDVSPRSEIDEAGYLTGSRVARYYDELVQRRLFFIVFPDIELAVDRRPAQLTIGFWRI
jgi:hypothetical protein